MDHRAGDQFAAVINRTDRTIRIVAIRRPTLPEILNVFPKLREG
jgi:hypothetical protein